MRRTDSSPNSVSGNQSALHVVSNDEVVARVAIRRHQDYGERSAFSGRKGLALGIAACALLGAPAVGFAADDVSALVGKYGCQACHAVDRKVLGPSFEDVATKYAGDATAPDKLQLKVKTGGSGVWGAIPMPPNNVPDDDRKAIVKWILGTK